MQHFANFGAIRKANKIKKKTWEKDSTGNSGATRWDINEARSMRNEENPDPLASWQRPYNNGLTARNKIAERRVNPRKISASNDLSKPNLDQFTDVRPNEDYAINAEYLGFRKDPFKGYGGMVEEPVDYKKKITNRGINRFDMRGGVEP